MNRKFYLQLPVYFLGFLLVAILGLVASIIIIPVVMVRPHALDFIRDEVMKAGTQRIAAAMFKRPNKQEKLHAVHD